MDPFAFTTEEEGILMAERALDELRVFLHAIDGHGGGRSAPGPSNGTPPMAFLGGDQGFALHEQLHDLEGILRMITDARLARTLIEDENERVAAENGDGENMNLLAVIIMTAREVMTFQTYVGFDPLYDDQGSDDEDLGTQAGPSGGQIVVNRVQTDIFNLGLGDDDGARDPPPSPLSQFSDEPDIPVPQIPSCVVCFEELLSPTGRLEAPCGHYYCSTCAINLVDTYTAQVFPPGPLRCCPSPHPPIAPRYVYRFIDHNKRVLLEEKIAEAETPYDQRIYCPQEICQLSEEIAGEVNSSAQTGVSDTSVRISLVSTHWHVVDL
ncbi:hypothetical protein D9756_007982 [Leucocoprinus leucothites]|uniref:RING-type domain-containing protein n=1 Tax=Leucocoprinus leucothites TaxID=201217 RepID=A0A8H5FXF6_9AGAR|nr:hypothetical protein D9756_007982 [Leucoagaricus leucothites]